MDAQDLDRSEGECGSDTLRVMSHILDAAAACMRL